MKGAELLTELKGVGPSLAEKLAVLGLKTADDLINFYPRRYEDFSMITPINQLRPGPVTIEAQIKQAKDRYARRGLHITEAVASDKTDSLRLVWFNQPYRAASLQPGETYFISGNYELSHQRFAIMNPSIELASSFPINTARILPIYRQTKGLTSIQIRKVASQLVPLMRELPETLPDWLVAEQKLMARSQAIEMMHFPSSSQALADAKRRLGFEEVFSLSLASLLVKHELATESAPVLVFDEKLAKQFVASLPFQLTSDQRRVAWQIFKDLEQAKPANRLIEGDVGSGKTVVAAMTAALAMKAGYQVAFMAPTELLARQHADTLSKLLAPLGLDKEVSLLVGSQTPAQKSEARKRLASGDCQLIVGTHALIQEQVDYKKLALVTVDEQHRFGVDQRQKLQKKAGHAVHTLSLTATPIPRSLALVLYGELDISLIAEKPPDRLPVATKIVSPNSRAPVYAQIKQELDAGRQMFVVCPLISESEVLDANSAEKTFDQFSKHEFKNYKVGLLHGQMRSDAKNEIMRQFVEHELDILVATTVIEVGVDVPNASVMLIEAPERFGLAQIHQLRGRVGRGKAQGYCYLMMSDSKAPTRRLRALESSNDGFKLAELDLEIRGPGAIYGRSQHGQLDLRVATLTDVRLIAAARASAQTFIDSGESLLRYRELNAKVKQLQAVTTLN